MVGEKGVERCGPTFVDVDTEAEGWLGRGEKCGRGGRKGEGGKCLPDEGAYERREPLEGTVWRMVGAHPNGLIEGCRVGAGMLSPIA